ncbi:TetR/AcrR family transcriptional regulator [Paenibacillus puldeungensis]|uniref:TetR/AcrR family transcriptional regulator n=1 Tax=Paenibacillus puldeungensis TaxID=696536 RepID=A0ABW3S3G4_9BACL
MEHLEQDTKERILNAALDLFCINGYTTVSIRDIGKTVGIKESSIYYHFKNKEDILQTIFQQTEQWTEIHKNNFNDKLYLATKVNCEQFIGAGITYILDYLLDERIYKFIRLLTIEKQRNKEAADMYHKLLFATPLEHQKNVFSIMMEKGYIKEDNSDALAAEYQSMILFVFLKYFSDPQAVVSEVKSAAKKELSTLLMRFFIHYFNEVK